MDDHKEPIQVRVVQQSPISDFEKLWTTYCPIYKKMKGITLYHRMNHHEEPILNTGS